MYFICPYSNKRLMRACEVSSCNFNLPNIPLSRAYKRCFLNYLDSGNFNPMELERVSPPFNELPENQRQQIIAAFFEIDRTDVMAVKGNFYLSFLSIITQEALSSSAKRQLAPVPYRQCAICGTESKSLFLPPSGCLPAGYGYCSYKCYQLKPPPLLTLEQLLEIDYQELVQNPEFSVKNRARFVRYLIEWVLSDIPMV